MSDVQRSVVVACLEVSCTAHCPQTNLVRISIRCPLHSNVMLSLRLPVLRLVCSGEVGSATSMKLVINMLFGTMLAGLAETLALGEKVGLQQEQILEILSLLPISSKLNLAKGDGLFTAFICLFLYSSMCDCLMTVFCI